MMSNNNMLGGPREASQTTPQPNTTLVNQLIQIELEGLTLRNVALGLAIYVRWNQAVLRRSVLLHSVFP